MHAAMIWFLFSISCYLFGVFIGMRAERAKYMRKIIDEYDGAPK